MPAESLAKLAGLADRSSRSGPFLEALTAILESSELEEWRTLLLEHGHYLRYDQLYLSNYALMHLRDEIQRLPGISDVLALRPARLQHAHLGRSRPAGRAAT